MRRKPTKKRVNKTRKKVPKKSIAKSKLYETGTYHKRGTARKSIVFKEGKKSFAKIITTLDNHNYAQTFDYLRRKNKPDGKHYKPPQGITVIITVLKGGKTYTYTRISDVDFVVNNANIKAFILEKVKELENDWSAAKDTIEAGEEDEQMAESGIPADYMENLDPKYIIDITVNFMYGK